jgi:hypothetical protein
MRSSPPRLSVEPFRRGSEVRLTIRSLAACPAALGPGAAGAHGDVVSRTPDEGATAPYVPR